MAGLSKLRSLKRRVGRPLRKFIQQAREWRRHASAYRYDQERYLKHTGAAAEPNEARHNFMLSREYHSYEKGMALPEPRLRFRKDTLPELISMIGSTERAYGPSVATAGARQSLRQYHAWHQDNGIEMPDLARFLEDDPGTRIEAGTRTVNRAHLRGILDNCNFTEFVMNRHSVRNFTGEPVDPADMEQAVTLAVKSPSVCNRSTGKIYVAYDEAQRNRLLSFQGGNRGFGHLAGAIVVVASDMRGFRGVRGRNQCWVDGGLFAMTLCYALHAQGYGTCMLNWSVAPEADRAMREAFGIPDHDAIITMMAVGRIPETFEVAVSPRRPASDHIVVLRSQ